MLTLGLAVSFLDLRMLSRDSDPRDCSEAVLSAWRCRNGKTEWMEDRMDRHPYALRR